VDQYYTLPEVRDVLVTSAQKNVDTAVYNYLKSVNAGSAKAGIVTANVKNGGVGLAPYHDWYSKIPDLVKAKVAEAIAGYKSGGTAGSTLKLALLVPLSGANPTFGASARNGALLAIDEWNAKGGVLGKQIEAVVEDSQCEAEPGRAAANKVIDQDKVHYIVGEICSKASIPISEIAEAKHVVQISPTSTNPQVTLNTSGSTKQYVFRACFIDPFQGTVMANFAFQKGYKTAFVMSDQGNDYVKGLAEAFVAAFKKNGGRIVGQETYNGTTDTDFSAILAKVAGAKPDVLYLPDYYPIANLVGKQAKEKGITTVIMGGDGWDSAELDVAALEGSYFSNHYDPSDTREVVKNWLTDYGAAYHGATPDALATLGYDSTNLMLTAIQQAGADDPAKVKDALAGIRFNGVTGTLAFDARHNPVKSAVIMHIQAGQKVYAGTVNP
jgi:branched-chain amino acid transport system substrate-binding protein